MTLTYGDGETAEVSAVAVSARDKYILAGTGDGIVKVWHDWKGKQPKLVRTITTEINPTFNQRARVMSLDFHPREENTFAILDRLGIKLYRLDEDEPLVRLPRHSTDLEARVRFSADGRYLISTAYRERDYVFWLWHPDEMIKDACDSFLVDSSETKRDNVCSSSLTEITKLN
jgi:WD40 repeat protein